MTREEAYIGGQKLQTYIVQERGHIFFEAFSYQLTHFERLNLTTVLVGSLGFLQLPPSLLALPPQPPNLVCLSCKFSFSYSLRFWHLCLWLWVWDCSSLDMEPCLLMFCNFWMGTCKVLWVLHCLPSISCSLMNFLRHFPLLLFFPLFLLFLRDLIGVGAALFYIIKVLLKIKIL